MLLKKIMKKVSISRLRSLASPDVFSISWQASRGGTSGQWSIPVSHHDQVVAFWQMCQCGLQGCPKSHPIFHTIRSMYVLIRIQYVNAACLSMDPNVHESSRNRFIPWNCIGLAQLFGYQCEKASAAAATSTVKTMKMSLHPFAGKGPVRFLDRNDINALLGKPTLHPIPVSWGEPSTIPTHHC